VSDWKKVGENLVRHSGGTIYLRGRVGGKPIRVSLGTNDLRIAKIARDAKLDALRQAAIITDISGAKSIGDMIDVLAGRIIQPHMKESTGKYYRDMMRLLRDTMPIDCKAQSWTATEATAWWRAFAKGRSPQRANQALAVARRVGELIVESGLQRTNPAEKLKRLPIPRPHKDLPSASDIERVILEIRAQKLKYSEEAGNFVAFLYLSGLRVGEAAAVLWADISDDWLTVTGGAKMTKNRRTRKVPIIPPMRVLLDGMRLGKNPSPSTPLFSMKSPHNALRNACRRLDLPHMHPHMLRHHFTTWAIEAEVDIPTVSRWLGHSDGGVLVMKTYGHLRDDHSLKMADKMSG
jgi:integrase